jgi:hypothetical protein
VKLIQHGHPYGLIVVRYVSVPRGLELNRVIDSFDSHMRRVPGSTIAIPSVDCVTCWRDDWNNAHGKFSHAWLLLFVRGLPARAPLRFSQRLSCTSEYAHILHHSSQGIGSIVYEFCSVPLFMPLRASQCV